MEKIYFKIKRKNEINYDYHNLPQHIIKHCLEKKDENSISTSLFAYSLLNELLNKFNSNIDSLYFSINGKPFIDDGYISISHSKDYVIVSFSKVNHGIDLQVYNDSINKENIMKKYFKDHYNDYLLEENEGKINLFYKLWTLREAICKKDGITIFEDITIGTNYSIVELLEYKDKYMLSFVSDSPFIKIEIE